MDSGGFFYWELNKLSVLGNAKRMNEKLKLYKEHSIIVICENTELLPEGVAGISIRCFDRPISDWEKAEKGILGVNCLC
jgi:hypothetical protein